MSVTGQTPILSCVQDSVIGISELNNACGSGVGAFTGLLETVCVSPTVDVPGTHIELLVQQQLIF